MSEENEGKGKKGSWSVSSYLEKIRTKLDPRLQKVILDTRAGVTLDGAYSQTAEDGTVSVDVVAKLHDPGQRVPGLNVVRTVDCIVTGTVAVDAIEAVRGHANVAALKLAGKVYRQLNHSVTDIEAAPPQLAALLTPGEAAVDGNGVIIGIVDTGCDFKHPNFRHSGTQNTRLLYLWDQKAAPEPAPPAGFGYGREFDAAAINRALGKEKPYDEVSYKPGPASHGTHVMDIAAGNGQATGNQGVAPGTDLIFVDLGAEDIAHEKNLGNAKKLIEAVEYIFIKAEQLGKPAVVNISLSMHGGPHDGSTPVEIALDCLLRAKPGRAIVMAAGNSREKDTHASGKVANNAPKQLQWKIFGGDSTRDKNELEIWYDGAHKGLTVSLLPPDGGDRVGPVALDNTASVTSGTRQIGFIVHRENDSGNGDNHIDIFFHKTQSSGIWTVELSNSDPVAVDFHAWIERDDDSSTGDNLIFPNQSRFVETDADPHFTIGSIACGEKTIAVGAYKATAGSALAPFSAEGPTRNNRRKPDVSAPGVSVLAAESLTAGAMSKNGTSMAAPHVAGLIALLMQAAGRPLSVDDIRRVVIDSARKNPPAEQSGWDAGYGWGRVSVEAALRKIRQ